MVYPDPNPVTSTARDESTMPPPAGTSRAKDEEFASDEETEGLAAERKSDPNIADTNGGPSARANDGPLFSQEKCKELNRQWQLIQASFVDQPQAAVKQADALVTKTIDNLATSFSELRGSLEKTWERDEEVSTENLRQALQSYRSFFRRLLSA